MLTSNTSRIYIFLFFILKNLALHLMFVHYWLLFSDQLLLTFKYHFLKFCTGKEFLGLVFLCIYQTSEVTSCLKILCVVVRDLDMVELVSNRLRRLSLRYVTLRKSLSSPGFSLLILQKKDLCQVVLKITPHSHIVIICKNCLT